MKIENIIDAANKTTAMVTMANETFISWIAFVMLKIDDLSNTDLVQLI